MHICIRWVCGGSNRVKGGKEIKKETISEKRNCVYACACMHVCISACAGVYVSVRVHGSLLQSVGDSECDPCIAVGQHLFGQAACRDY